MGKGTSTVRSERSVSTTLLRLPNVKDYFWVAAVATAYLYLFVRVQWRIGDEGDMLNGALAVTQGRVPYRDFYDLRGPLSFYGWDCSSRPSEPPGRWRDCICC